MTLSIRLWTLWLVLLSSLCLSTVSYAKDRIRYYVNGADGSPLRVVDEKGNTVAAYRYSPFGESLAQKKPVRQVGPSRFVGGIEESNDLVYLKHRYYNPRIGRFYQPDPINFLAGGVGQTNRYQYGWNDPFTYQDPLGLISTGQWLDEAALRAAAEDDGGPNFQLALLSFAAVYWDKFGAENTSLAYDGQNHSGAGLTLEIASALPPVKFAGFAGKLVPLGKVSKLNPCGCFDDNTPVLTPTGPRQIVKLKEGDLVLAKDEQTGLTSYQPITTFYIVPNRTLYQLNIIDSNRQRSSLEVSDDHPFWVVGRGWVKSIALKAGDQLLNTQNQIVTVVSLIDTHRVETTYNLEVANYHTFFAGQAGVWVHNGGPCNLIIEKILQAQRIGSGLKEDVGHRAASFLSKEQLQSGRIFMFRGGDGVERTLLQTEGGLNGKNGIYEYILDPSGSVTHQPFIERGVINGVPNQKVPKVVP